MQAKLESDSGEKEREGRVDSLDGPGGSTSGLVDMQQQIGNSATTQITAPSSGLGSAILPTVTPASRRGGDKLAFEAQTDDVKREDEPAKHAVQKIIEKHQAAKRELKMRFEADKERQILDADREAEVQLEELAKRLDPRSVLFDFEREKISAAKIKKNKATLAEYHDRVQEQAGWRWAAIKKELEEAGLEVMDGGAWRDTTNAVLANVSGPNGSVVYRVYFNDFRFSPGKGSGPGQVITPRGYGASRVAPPSKQYIRDSNDVPTRRFVSRAITLYHIASMFGLAIRPPDSKFDPRDADLAEKLRTKVDDVDAEPAISEAYGDDTRTTPLDEQRPRFTKSAFGQTGWDGRWSGHDDVFDLRQSATYTQASRRPNPYFGDNYASRGAGVGKGNVPLPPGIRTQFSFTTGQNDARRGTEWMGGGERASMQVRNGSGPLQPYLSTASTQDPRKVIRANKGERFDTGAENQGTVKVDLSIAQRLGVDVVNQHSEDSHRHKIAYDRYYDKGDLKALARKWAHLEKLGKTDEMSPKEFEGLSDQAIRHIKEGNPELVDHKAEAIKRTAPQELDEYIYSARKNREVLMDRIPLACITEIKLSTDIEKWPFIYPTISWHDWPSLRTGVWLKMDDVKADLKKYLTGDKAEGYQRVKRMFMRAAKGKQEESGRT